ncbi:MAG: class I SAM-dependent methyltransferase [Deltaproteobacteria bacterium]|nr:MAG: class I SAM-dependent methyltransferase [Deltaproteobacteria bacterium]
MARNYKAKDHYQREDIVDSYDLVRFVGIAGRIINSLEKRALKRALAREAPGLRILDMPCGTGRMCLLLSSRNYWVVGADISQGMLDLASGKQKDSSVTFPIIRADAERLPFKAGSFDYVISLRFMMHLPPEIRVKVLREMARIAQKGLVVNYHLSGTSLLGIFNPRFRKHILPPFITTKSEMRKEIQVAGLLLRREFGLLKYVSSSEVFLLQKNEE